MTIPNLLTLIRIFLTPVLVWLLLDGRFSTAFFVFFVAGMTDALDGLLARLLNQKSRFGAYIDPLADKILLMTSFFILGYIGKIPLWLVIIVVSRDIMILLGLFTLVFYQVKVEIRPVVSSKLTTFFQLLTVFLWLFRLGYSLVVLPDWFYMFLYLTTAAFSIFSGGRYLQIGIAALGGHRTRNTDPRGFS
jgi:cardiolipin synthase (CMP-forming)